MREIFMQPSLPGTQLRLYQLDTLIKTLIPSVGSCLEQHKLPIQMFATGWVMTLFLTETTLSPEACCIILDDFIMYGWCAMMKLYLGLIALNVNNIVKPQESFCIQALVKLPKSLCQQMFAIYHDSSKFSEYLTSKDLSKLEKNYNSLSS